MEKKTAIKIQKLSLDAVHALHQALRTCESGCSDEDRRRIERGVGLSIGRIETDLLGVIYAAYPELDDLTDVPNLRNVIRE
jgi:hypothetical protein